MNAGDASRQGDVTQLLQAAREGERGALDRLIAVVYDELRVMARRQLSRERSGHTLHATALVHEAYVKLAGGPIDATDRAHFLAIAARAMRQILVDHARRKKAQKRGGEWEITTLTDGSRSVEFNPEEMLALDRALDELDERQRQVVEFRFFGGMEETEIATVLAVSERTVRRDWVKARAWLYRSLYPQSSSPPPNGEGSPQT